MDNQERAEPKIHPVNHSIWTGVAQWSVSLVTILLFGIGCGESNSADTDSVLAPTLGGEMNSQSGVLAGGMAAEAQGVAPPPNVPQLIDEDAGVNAMAPPASEPEPDSTRGTQVIEFNDVPVTMGYTEKLELDLPKNVLSVTIVAEGQNIHFYTIEHFEGPNGEILVAENPPGVQLTANDRRVSPFPGPFKSPNRSASAGSAIGTLLAPNNPGVIVRPGKWSFAVGALGMFGRTDAVIDVTVMVKTGPSPQVRGTLDVHFHFTGSKGWTAETAQTDRNFQAAVERMASFYRPIGIELVNFTYDDIDPMYREVDSGPMGPGSGTSKIEEMFALNRYNTGIALFFVDRIGTGQFGGFIGGLSGGTPGPSGMGGTTRSGVAVATAMTPDPDSIGHIMGHESGHFLGLFHTQEIIGFTDQIDDTMGGLNGSDNLMFPTVTSEPARLTDGQAWVLHRSPIVVAEEDQ